MPGPGWRLFEVEQVSWLAAPGQVSLLAVLGGLAGVAMAVPLGPWIEFHHKRPTLIAADLIRFAALAGSFSDRIPRCSAHRQDELSA